MTDIDENLVRQLITAQFPQWRALPIRSVANQGWDNRTFRLGDDLTVRLPSAAGYVPAVAKEDRWLPRLAPFLSVPIPVPVAVGTPSEAYPFPWSIRRWLHGHPLDSQKPDDPTRLAEQLGAFLVMLRSAPPDGPLAGSHSFYRGCHPSAYGDQVQTALAKLGPAVDAASCWAIWKAGTATVWTEQPVWFHGDVAAGNVLIDDDGLAAMIDFGTSGVGDPACDLQIAWTYFSPPERQVLRRSAGLDDDCWHRARAWALWKELIGHADSPDGRPAHVLQEILDDPVV
ncbi:MAG TPA: aminoglycoside phosphotransferase family protein [Microlunatus sp.]